MRLNYITNENKNLQDKIRYFADYFSFVNEFLGKLPEIPFDNPLSLVDKTIFQIENNFENCVIYVIDYLSQLYLHFDVSNDLKNILFIKIKNQYKTLRIQKTKKDWIKANSSFLKDLKELKDSYEGLFEKHFSELLSYIKCSHPLRKHKLQIQFATKILVSQFRFKGHTKESLDTYVGRIISNDEYEFPFPPEILKIESKEYYKESTKKFFENLNFDNQFEGLKKFYVADLYKEGYFFYVIDNCILNESVKDKFKISFHRVTFITPLHKDLRKLRKSVKEEDRKNGMKMFSIFFGKNKLLAYVNLRYEKKSSTKDEGLKIVDDELTHLNQYIDGPLILNNLHYLVYDHFQSELWHASRSFNKVKKAIINERAYKQMINNPYELLRNIESPSKPIIIQIDKVFLKAFANDEIESYWFFIENMFAPLDIKSEEVRKDVVKIMIKLLDDLKYHILTVIGILFHPLYFNCEEENFDKQEAYLLSCQILKRENNNFDIYQYKNRISNTLLKDLLNYHKNCNSEKNINKWKDYFSSLFIDLYAYRNSLVHSGSTDPYSKIKLSSILPKLISRVRWLLINTCKENSNMAYKELIKKMQD